MIGTNQQTGYLQFVYDFYKLNSSHEIILAYEGEMNHELMKIFTNIVMRRLTDMDRKYQVNKKLYHVMIECLQNISKHAFQSHKTSEPNVNPGILIISMTPDHYLITTGNTMEIERTEDLHKFLEKVNSLNYQDLDELYRHQLKEGKLSDKGGAGLGFIDIKRKSGQNLDFHFLPQGIKHSFFLFSSTIKRVK